MNKRFLSGFALLAVAAAVSLCAKDYVLFNQTDEPISYLWHGYKGGIMGRDPEERSGTLEPGKHVLLTDVKPWTTNGSEYFRTEGSGSHVVGFGFILKNQAGETIFKGAPELDGIHPAGSTHVGVPYAIAYTTASTPQAAKLQRGKISEEARLGYGVKRSPEQNESVLVDNGYGLIVTKVKAGTSFLDNGKWDSKSRKDINDVVRAIGATERSTLGESTPLRYPTNVEVATVYPEGGSVGKPKQSVRNYYDYRKDQTIVLEGADSRK